MQAEFATPAAPNSDAQHSVHPDREVLAIQAPTTTIPQANNNHNFQTKAHKQTHKKLKSKLNEINKLAQNTMCVPDQTKRAMKQYCDTMNTALDAPYARQRQESFPP